MYSHTKVDHRNALAFAKYLAKALRACAALDTTKNRTSGTPGVVLHFVGMGLLRDETVD